VRQIPPGICKNRYMPFVILRGDPIGCQMVRIKGVELGDPVVGNRRDLRTLEVPRWSERSCGIEYCSRYGC
jgi:hypothetical protein